MIDKKELISIYLQQFGSHYQMSRLLNPTLRIDDEFISRFFEQIVDQYGEAFAVTEEEKAEIERKIKSQYLNYDTEQDFDLQFNENRIHTIEFIDAVIEEVKQREEP